MVYQRKAFLPRCHFGQNNDMHYHYDVYSHNSNEMLAKNALKITNILNFTFSAFLPQHWIIWLKINFNYRWISFINLEFNLIENYFRMTRWKKSIWFLTYSCNEKYFFHYLQKYRVFTLQHLNKTLN